MTRDDVEWAYRMILGREPESEVAILGHLELSDRDTLRRSFINCAEFRKFGGVDDLLIGRFQNVTGNSVQVDCTADQRALMVAHIASEWCRYGAEAPHWSVITSSEFKPENIENNIEWFYETGRHHAATMLYPFSRAGVDIAHFDRVMDFGCGVGRLTLGLGPVAGEILGVDISPLHLDLARDRARDDANIKFASIESIKDIVRFGYFDLIVSFIALQHNPPPIMVEILQILISCLSSNGCIIIQMPTYIDGYHFHTENYLLAPNDGISANALPQHAIFKIFSDGGCDVLEVREDTLLGGASLSHTFAARKR